MKGMNIELAKLGAILSSNTYCFREREWAIQCRFIGAGQFSNSKIYDNSLMQPRTPGYFGRNHMKYLK